jgi:hypothetical protein
LAKLHNEHVIIAHTTQRTSTAEIRRILKQTLPEEIHERIILLMDRRGRRPARVGDRA